MFDDSEDCFKMSGVQMQTRFLCHKWGKVPSNGVRYGDFIPSSPIWIPNPFHLIYQDPQQSAPLYPIIPHLIPRLYPCQTHHKPISRHLPNSIIVRLRRNWRQVVTCFASLNARTAVVCQAKEKPLSSISQVIMVGYSLYVEFHVKYQIE